MRQNVIVCFYIVSLPGHSIKKYVSFSDYRWQCLYCLLFNGVTVGSGVACWWNMEMRA